MKAVVRILSFLLGLVSVQAYAQPRYTVANGEYANFILDNSTQTLYGVGGGPTGIGTNTGQIGYPIPCQFPNPNTQIKFVAAGLHTASAIDVNGNVYFTGANEDGTLGNGTTTGGTSAFQQITTDINGNPFTNVTYLRMASAIFTGGAGYGAIIYAVKGDGTLWVWGNTQGGYAGDGTYGQIYTRPKQITSFPAGTVITKVMIQNIVIALDANGNVWTWAGNGNPALLGNSSQTDYETPHMITLPSKAIDIAGAGLFSYALLDNHSLYGWGWYTGYMGVSPWSGSGVVGLNPPSIPMLLDTSLNLPAKINRLSTNGTSTYVILTDGSLWGWGGNECGQVGNGQELNYKLYTNNPAPYGGTIPAPYAWNQDASTAQCQQHKPVNIAPGMNNFVDLSEGVAAVFYKFAIDANNQLYSCGRNKGGVLGNGVMEGNYVNGGIVSTYPNSYDVPYVTAINPFQSGAQTIQSTSPWCLLNPTATSCSLYPVPANTPPNALINGVKNGTAAATGTTASLDGTASTDNVAIVYYVWSQVSGPNTPIISIPSGKKVNLIGLQTGTYVFKLRVTDNGWASDSTTITLMVNGGGPVVSAGTNQTITLPTNSVTLTGNATETGGTIISYAWTQISGPNSSTISTSTQASTSVGGLVQGVYTYQLLVTDATGVTATAQVQVTVNPAPGPPIAVAGSAQTITLPTNSVTLPGGGSELNGSIVSYSWTQVSGPSAATFGATNVASTTVSNLVQGVYTFQLMITDALGINATAQVQVTVNPAVVAGPPSANAGSDQTITLPVNSVTLTGSGSETNGTIVSYNWTQVSGPSTATTFGTASAASTTAGALVQGVYIFQLTVTDNSGVTATDQMKVTVNPAVPVTGTPVVSAGANQTITLPTNSASLAATASESGGTIASYSWTEVSGPNTAGIGTSNQASTTVTGLVQGVYTFQILVTDANNVTATDVTKVTVNAAPVVPGPPSANAGPDQTITLPTSSVTLTGSGSETNGTIVSYSWTQVSGPSSSSIADATQALTTVNNLVQGIYVFQLTVKDNSGVTATNQVQVTVNPAAGYPNANAGPNQTITLPTSSVTLAGSGSETNGTIVSYYWQETSGPSAAGIANPNQASTGVSGLVQGVYTFYLIVKDNSGVTSGATMTVTVAAAPGYPTPNAGPDQTITLPTSSVTLSGSGSETNGTIVSYYWQETSGPSGATITNPNSASTTVTGLVQGVYSFYLIIKDNSGVTAGAVMKVTVNAAKVNQPPVAIAGPAQTVPSTTTTVSLNGSASYDPDGTIVSYQWVQVSGAGGVTITNSTSATPSVYGLQVGTYVFQLTVTDNQGATGTDQVTITVTDGTSPTKNILVANAGKDTLLVQPDSIGVLNATGSTDNGGTIVSYSWTQVSGPGTAVISNPSDAQTNVALPQTGVYTFEVTVTDNLGNTDTSTVHMGMISDLRTSINTRIYPNPFTGSSITLTGSNSYTGMVNVSVYSLSGAQVTTYEFDKEATDFTQQIPMPNGLARGVYAMYVYFNGQSGKPKAYLIVKQ